MLGLLQILKERAGDRARRCSDVVRLVICRSRLSKRSSPFSDFDTLKLYLGAKIVQGERKAKCKAKGFSFSLPSRRLSWRSKVVQGERKAKCKANGFAFSLPSRCLSWRSKVCKASAKQNAKPKDFHFLCRAAAYLGEAKCARRDLFHVEHQSLQVFPLGMVDVDGVVSRLVQLV